MVRRPLLVTGLTTVALCAATVVVVVPASASPRAPFGVGVPNVTTGSVTHEWLGAYRVAVGHGGPVVNAYCIRSGGWFAGSPSWPVGDLAAARGATEAERGAMAYLLWRYGDTADPITAAALGAALYSLSADEMTPGVRYPPPAQMGISHGGVAATADHLYREGLARRAPWSVQVAAAPRPDAPWLVRASIHVSGPGGPIPEAVIVGTMGNGDGSGLRTTDAGGNVVVDIPPHDPAVPVSVDVLVPTPAPYRTLHDVELPDRQVVVHGEGVWVGGRAQAAVPAGLVRIVKRNTNPAWQDDAGARFELRSGGVDGPLSTTVDGAPAVVISDADGSSPPLVMAPGPYWVVETDAPPGQEIGFEPRRIDVAAGQSVTVDVENVAVGTSSLVLTKVDADTGEPLAGARLRIERDHAGESTYEPIDTAVASRASNGHGSNGHGSNGHGSNGHGSDGHGSDGDEEPGGSGGAAPEPGEVVTTDGPILLDGLLAGRYRVTEVEAPPGYTLPEVPEVVVELAVEESRAVDIGDVRPLVHTRVSTAEALVGEGIVDMVEVANVASWNRGQIDLDLYGPFEPDEAIACDEDRRAGSESWPVVGSGTFTSPAFVVDEPGRYTFVARWRSLEPGDASSATHPCGEPDETVLVRGFVPFEGVKFDAEDPDRRLAGGRYRMLVAFEDLPSAAEAARPDQSVPPVDAPDDPAGAPDDPAGAPDGDAPHALPAPPPGDVPEGFRVVAEGITDDRGELRVEVLSHARYCFEELEAPEGYVLDPELRCTEGVLTPGSSAPVELAEHRIPVEVMPSPVPDAARAPFPDVTELVRLPRTGRDLTRTLAAAVALVAAGGAVLLARRPQAAHRSRSVA